MLAYKTHLAADALRGEIGCYPSGLPLAVCKPRAPRLPRWRRIARSLTWTRVSGDAGLAGWGTLAVLRFASATWGPSSDPNPGPENFPIARDRRGGGMVGWRRRITALCVLNLDTTTSLELLRVAVQRGTTPVGIPATCLSVAAGKIRMPSSSGSQPNIKI